MVLAGVTKLILTTRQLFTSHSFLSAAAREHSYETIIWAAYFILSSSISSLAGVTKLILTTRQLFTSHTFASVSTPRATKRKDKRRMDSCCSIYCWHRRYFQDWFSRWWALLPRNWNPMSDSLSEGFNLYRRYLHRHYLCDRRQGNKALAGKDSIFHIRGA